MPRSSHQWYCQTLNTVIKLNCFSQYIAIRFLAALPNFFVIGSIQILLSVRYCIIRLILSMATSEIHTATTSIKWCQQSNKFMNKRQRRKDGHIHAVHDCFLKVGTFLSKSSNWLCVLNVCTASWGFKYQHHHRYKPKTTEPKKYSVNHYLATQQKLT